MKKFISNIFRLLAQRFFKERSGPRIETRIRAMSLVCVGAIACASGCASVAVKKLPAGGDDSMEGIRFYRPVPYLMVSEASSEPKQSNTSTSSSPGSSPAPTLQFTIVWMPDLSQEYAIRTNSGLVSIEFNPTLENGWNLTGLNAKVDSKTGELLTAVAGLVPKATAAAPRPAAAGSTLKPGMYPFVFERDRSKPNYGRIVGIDVAHPIFTVWQ